MTAAFISQGIGVHHAVNVAEEQRPGGSRLSGRRRILTNPSIVSRGLLRAGCSLLREEHEHAAVEPFSAVVSPAALAFAAARTPVEDVSHGASSLIDGLPDAGEPEPPDDGLDPLPEPPAQRNGRPVRWAA